MLKNLLTSILNALHTRGTDYANLHSLVLNQSDEIADLKVTIASLEETVSDYVALENEAIEIANQMKTAVDSWEN